jgi:hypothetical protein
MTAWTDMKPGHFDASLLPNVRKAAPGQGELFAVADVAPVPARAGEPREELDGQEALFAG